jgi:hypothetical protein
MSLIKKLNLSEKQLTANRRNQKLSHGMLTAEGRERIRAAHLRHGFRANAEGVALQALGEDPEQFKNLLEGFWEEFEPSGSLQEGLVIHLARTTWLMNRADRMQEGYALRLAKNLNLGRENRLHAQMMRLKMTEESLRLLLESVAEERYVTLPDDLDLMKGLQQDGTVKEMGQILVDLFGNLLPCGSSKEQEREQQSRNAVNRLKEIFGLQGDHPPSPPGRPKPEGAGEAENTAPPVQPVVPWVEEQARRYPQITAEQWEARERPRQLLENLLRRQVEACEARRKAIRQELQLGPSPYERAAEVAPIHPEAQRLRATQDALFREVRRVTNLLYKIKGRQRRLARAEEFGSE